MTNNRMDEPAGIYLAARRHVTVIATRHLLRLERAYRADATRGRSLSRTARIAWAASRDELRQRGRRPPAPHRRPLPWHRVTLPVAALTTGPFRMITFKNESPSTYSFYVDNVRFENDATGALVYDVDIVNSRTTYQFNRNFLIRFLAQYDSSARRVLTDALASYELVAGTVFHAGYGSLYERRVGEGNTFVPIDQGQQYLAINRGLFFKASYVHRF